MSLVLRLDKLRPEILSAAFAVAEEQPTTTEVETTKDKVRQIKMRRYKMLPAQLHRANALMATKGKPAYDQFLAEEVERFEEKRSAELQTALTELEDLELRQLRSTPEGVLLYALEIGLKHLATGNASLTRAMSQKTTK